MRFASLGSGSEGNGLLVEVGATRVMIDCGFRVRDTVARLGRIGVAPETVTAIIVTHEHWDHIGGVAPFAARFGTPVWLTFGTLAAVAERFAFLPRVYGFDSHDVFEVGDIEIRPFPVPHDAREPVQYVVSDGAVKLGVLTDIGASTAHVELTLSGLDALVLECNYDADMLWGGAYPKWLKQRIAGPFGHLDNLQSERLLAALDRSRLKHVIAAHLSQQNNRAELARGALARAMGCEESWIGLASQDDGFDWKTL
jgi:phosphoribosyl 1,2-cyclic phosphodiesterase